MKLINGDCLKVMPMLPENSIDTIITDPPYGFAFMGKEWDRGVPSVPFWEAALRVAKPGAMLLAFGGTRTYHRLMVAIEDAGWEIRDCMMWLYGSGFPKSMDISKAMDKAAGAEREVTGVVDTRGSFDGANRQSAAINTNWRVAEGRDDVRDLSKKVITAPATDAAKLWDGWGTALKPAWEPIIVAMKPLTGTYAASAQEHGVAGFNIDECRIETTEARPLLEHTGRSGLVYGSGLEGSRSIGTTMQGRWPANVILDEEAGVILDQQTGTLTSGKPSGKRSGTSGSSGIYSSDANRAGSELTGFGDSGGASRFFYCAKASKKEKGKDNPHPTVKPQALMEYLCKLTKTPTGGVVLDPFMGSGSTGVAAKATGRDFIGIELDGVYYKYAATRLEAA